MNDNIRAKRTKYTLVKRGNRTLIGLLAGVLLIAGTLVYSYDMEPKTLTVTRHNIASSAIPSSFDGKTILQFSDVHLGKDYTHDQLQTLVNRINREQPDIVVFTGDLIDNFNQYGSQRNEARHLLAQIEAPLGKYAVFGNHDRLSLRLLSAPELSVIQLRHRKPSNLALLRPASGLPSLDWYGKGSYGRPWP
ncbi:metallophosphoesterase [Paenibacillus apiarius]|uniref:metallophosphoesterase n=1 Tax=Paenibacillus apiarius TaxID=46240 RepID=UPI003B3BA1A8